MANMTDDELEQALEHDATVPAGQRTGRQRNGLGDALEQAISHLDRGETAAARAVLENALARMRVRGVWL